MPNIHIIHVGPMSNKGTQALLKSDDAAIREIVEGEISLSVSTADIEGVKKLCLPSETQIFPTIIDIPYVLADSLAKRMNISRQSISYKILSIFCLFLMFIQTALTILSSCAIRLNLPVLYRRKLFNAMKKSDVIISCSDENFKESASMLPLNFYWVITWWTMLFERMMEVTVAKFIKKPLVMFPNSVGPFKTSIGHLLSKLSLNNFQTLIVREKVSFNMLKKMGAVPVTLLTSDAALLFEPKLLDNIKKYSSNSIGVCIGVYSQSLGKKKLQDFMDENAKALDHLIELFDFDVCFFPHFITGFEFDDLDVSKKVLNKMKHKDHAKVYKIDQLDEFKLSLNQMLLLVSSKMHPMVLGSTGFVPTVCIAYDHKQTGFLNDLGLQNYLIHLEDLNHELIESKVCMAMENREQVILTLKNRIPIFQKNIKEAMEIALGPFVKIKKPHGQPGE